MNPTGGAVGRRVDGQPDPDEYLLERIFSRANLGEDWLRRRVRMCYWKQWRYCRTKVRELIKLGTFLHAAILVGLSRKPDEA
jgi:hypothetical protein